MSSSEELLEQAAKDGTWDSENWPEVLEDVIARLDKIIRSEFPIPVLPPEPPPVQLGSPLHEHEPSSQDSQTSNKENAPTKSPLPKPPTQSLSTTPAATTLSLDYDEYPPDFPPDLAAFHKSIQKSLQSDFPKYPPHTIQRLAELILQPKRHYRFLPSYLNALDRVISVSSTTAVFPLPQATLPHTGSVLNGVNTLPSMSSGPELGSDESLGGALLTPIPWLTNRDSQRSSSSANEKELQTSSTEIVEGPNGAGRIETVNVVNGIMSPIPSHQGLSLGTSGALASQNHTNTIEETLRAEGAVTQGELLRQEQEAGVVPVQPRGLRMSDEEMDDAGAGSTTDTNPAAEEEKPHARGPEEIGMEDTGPQDRPAGAALDLNAAVGRSRREGSVDREVDPEDASLSDAGGGEGREEEMKDIGETETEVLEESE